jgi:hypothetical protein
MSECDEERQESGTEKKGESHISSTSSAFDVRMATLETSAGMPKLSIRDP